MRKFSDEELFERIDLGVRRGVTRALAEHKAEGRSIVVWQDGKCVWIPPEEIKIDEQYLPKKKGLPRGAP